MYAIRVVMRSMLLDYSINDVASYGLDIKTPFMFMWLLANQSDHGLMWLGIAGINNNFLNPVTEEPEGKSAENPMNHIHPSDQCTYIFNPDLVGRNTYVNIIRMCA